MAARLVLFSGFTLLITGLIFLIRPTPEPITLTPPSGYSVAQKIEAPQEMPFVSALEYAQAFSHETVPAPVQAPIKKHTPKRHIAKAKAKRLKLVAKR